MSEWVIQQKRFRHKRTGEIVTQIPILEISNFEEVQEQVGDGPDVFEQQDGAFKESREEN